MGHSTRVGHNTGLFRLSRPHRRDRHHILEVGKEMKKPKPPQEWATKEWFDNYWQTGTTLGTVSSRLRAYGHTIDWIAKNNINSIVDLGCGDGQFYGLLRLVGWNGLYRGFDISDVALAKARETFPTILFQQADLHNLDLSTTEGAIVSHFVYGWVKDPVACLSRLPEDRPAAITIRVLPHNNFPDEADVVQMILPCFRDREIIHDDWKHRNGVLYSMLTVTGITR